MVLPEEYGIDATPPGQPRNAHPIMPKLHLRPALGSEAALRRAAHDVSSRAEFRAGAGGTERRRGTEERFRGLRAGGGAGIFASMNTTLEIDETLLAEARKLVGRRQQSVLVRMGLEALIEREAARRLAALGGTMPALETPRRQRSAPVAR